MGGFAHLHVRSGFSYGFGTATPEELVDRAAETGMGALALTDRDTLAGIPRFLKSAADAGVAPIVGAEITVEAGEDGERGHVVLLAKSDEGYRSLCRLITAYRLDGEDRRRPACTLPTLLKHSDGLVCLTGAIPFGLLPGCLSGGDTVQLRKSRRLALLLRDAFGGDLYMELTDDRTAGSRRRIARVAGFAEEVGVPTVVTNEVAYLSPADHRLHDALVAASHLTALPGPGYRPTDRLHLAATEEMRRVWRDHPEALANAAAIAERCAGAVELTGAVHVPDARLRSGEDADGKLFSLAVRGVREKYGGLGGGIVRRLRRELGCIEDLGLAPYFLIAREAVEIAQDKGVPVTGRGSAANSLVAYALGLTQPEPFSNRLLFERFLHERRADPPDIDLDLCSRRRDEVRDELMGRYARVGAAVAATAGTMSLRGAVRVAARALGHPPREIDDLARHVPARVRDRDDELRPVAGWEQALAEPAMRGHPLQDREKHRLLLELSWRLKGHLHGAGTHLGGVVFGTRRRHLSELVPLEPGGKEGLIRCQYDKDDLEYAGIPKLDLLGLRMHSALHEAGELASARLGKLVDPLSPPPNDRETYGLIRTGRTAGMFQLESPGQMSLARRLKPRRFADIVAQVSLFRPGPIRADLTTPYVMRRNGRERYEVPLPELDEILRPTYGILLYQEQVLEIAHRVAGFTLAEGDLLRRAMTKDRGPDAMRGIRLEFLSRARERGVPPEKAARIFSWVEGFAAYGFPAAHAASFAQLAYASAYMRRHYPAEYFCGVLNAEPMGFYSPRLVLNEARRAGIEILPPSIHRSGDGVLVEREGRALRVGLRCCKGLSSRAIETILEERGRRPLEGIADLYRRTAIDRGALETLIHAGFLDGFSSAGTRGRPALLARTTRLPEKPRRGDGRRELPHPTSWWRSGDGAASPMAYLPPPVADLERAQWRALGLNVVRHPLSPFRDRLGDLGVVPSDRVLDLPHGTRARAAGMFEILQCPPTRSGKPVWFLLLEDEFGLLQLTIFEDVYERYGHVVHREGALLVEGRVEQDARRGFSFLAERITGLRRVLSARHSGSSVAPSDASSATG
jgi:error-prone DNA polymerase